MFRKKLYDILEISDKKNKEGVLFDFLLYSSIVMNILLFGFYTLQTVNAYSFLSIFYFTFYKFSIIIYSIELFLRIWTCVENEKYDSPIIGRMKYVLNPIILIEVVVIATYFIFGPLLNIVFLRSTRLLNLSQYIGESSSYSSYQLLRRSFFKRREELFITLFASIITLIICSYLMYFVEKNAQPEVFKNILPSFKWVFGILTNTTTTDFYPVTGFGHFLRIIMVIIGVLILGLPLSILTGGFISEIEDAKKSMELKENALLIIEAFKMEGKILVRNEVKRLNLADDARFRDLDNLSARLCFSNNELFETIRHSNQLRIRASKKTVGDLYAENFIVEYFPANEKFGTVIKRNSNVHIVSTQNYSDPGIGHFSRMIADCLGANYYANEYFNSVAIREEKRINFANNTEYLTPINKSKNAFNLWKICLFENIKKEDLVIYFGTAGGHNHGEFHILCGGMKGEDNFMTIKDPTHYSISKVEDFFNTCTTSFKKINLDILGHSQFGNTDINQCSRAIRKMTDANVISIYVNTNFLQFDTGPKYYQSIRVLSDELKSVI
jgi:voltage-gated potassium channel